MVFIILKILLFSVLILLILFSLFFIFWRFYFLRNPVRKIPEGNNIVSPADGKIQAIVPFKTIDSFVHKKFLSEIKTMLNDCAKEGFIILIVMNVFDVHYQRAPISGTVKKINYFKGKFVNAVLNAHTFKAVQNEKNEILFHNQHIKNIKVVQIAGAFARRIECFLSENQKINKGNVIGRINLGSQVLLIIPKTPKIKLCVENHQRVFGGKTIIAEY